MGAICTTSGLFTGSSIFSCNTSVVPHEASWKANDLKFITNFITTVLARSQENDRLTLIILDTRARELLIDFMVKQNDASALSRIGASSTNGKKEIFIDDEIVGNLKNLFSSRTEIDRYKLDFLICSPVHAVLFQALKNLMTPFINSSFFSSWCEEAIQRAISVSRDEYYQMEATIPILNANAGNGEADKFPVLSAEVSCPRKRVVSVSPWNVDTLSAFQMATQSTTSDEKRAGNLFQGSTTTHSKQGSNDNSHSIAADAEPIYATVAKSSKMAEEEALTAIDIMEMSHIMKYSRWLFPFISLVENLPLAIMISRVTSPSVRTYGRPAGYPLVYANKCFERLTLYKRNDIIGREYTNLLPMENLVYHGAYQASIMQHIVTSSTPTEAFLRLHRKDSSSFDSLLGTKPLLDGNGTVRYIILILYHAHVRDIVQCYLSDGVKNMLRILPDEI